MIGQLLWRGMLAGLIAGLLAFAMASTFGEPPLTRAIGFEASQADGHHHGEAHSHGATGEGHHHGDGAGISRATQSSWGLLTGVGVYSTALGGLFALVFALANGRLGRLSPRALSVLLAAGGFLALVAVPWVKYPPNPPGIGTAATIDLRTEVYFLLLAVSLSAMMLSVRLARPLRARLGPWNGVLAAGALYGLIAAFAWGLFPTVATIPAHFPAEVLWQFRLSSLGIQVIIWAVLGLVFGALVERARRRRQLTGRASATA
ncbi:putative cobalt transporter CbtA [Kushneria sinocarnis]|uniref:Putative cobalt transporter CbtA n=1 Tax=Kushneria sinocarnis TaxID=595502 RepID=A0A420X1R9_9GAMM|nr:CbtA family protein [Kushneria sinocarnis]RKR07687.1 putative cobalt transporter CbtA [Kushneria sinocarnis]